MPSWNGDTLDYVRQHIALGILRVDDCGRVWRTSIRSSHGNNLIRLVPERRAESVGGKGYLRIALHVPGFGLVNIMAHRVVFDHLVGPIPDGLQINHKDLCKTNNAPSNLEAVTAEENIQHSYRNGRPNPWSKPSTVSWRGKSRVTDQDVQGMREQRRVGATLKEIATNFKLSITHVHRLCESER
jgi:AraC-like DNA-binding protein